MKKSEISRRKFLGTAATVGVAGVVAPTILAGCAGGGQQKKVVPEVKWLDKAPDGPVLKAGLIGCGGRGSGAIINFMSAGPNLKVTALGDTFKDKIDAVREVIKKGKGTEVPGQEVPDENCFVGFDAYQKVIDSGVDLVILATPPFFRPLHVAAAIAAKKHVFAEKPIAVDPEGIRTQMANALKAKELGLTIVTGTQRRHQRNYVANYGQVQSGLIGDIVGGNIWWNGGHLWVRLNDPKWTEMEWMIRNWVNWTWLSGDHIVEQHVHNIDVMNWFMGKHPVIAHAMGSRQRRVTGDQFDNFSVEYIFDNGIHIHSQCRQIDGCWGLVAERLQGTKGSTNCQDTLLDLTNKEIWKYQNPLDEKGQPTRMKPAMDQEHVDFVTSIRTNQGFNELENTANSTMTAIMGRISAYTGKETTWDEMMNSDLKLGPKVFAFGKVDVPKEVPVAGIAFDPVADAKRSAERAAARAAEAKKAAAPAAPVKK